MKNPITWFMICFALILGGVAVSHLTQPTYIGKVVFYSDTEYTAFKESLSQPDINIEKLAVLNTSPTVVSFTINAPYYVYFPYAEKDYVPSVVIGTVSLLFLIAGIAIGYISRNGS